MKRKVKSLIILTFDLGFKTEVEPQTDRGLFSALHVTFFLNLQSDYPPKYAKDRFQCLDAKKTMLLILLKQLVSLLPVLTLKIE